MEKISEPVSCGYSSEYHEYKVCDQVIPKVTAEQVFQQLTSKKVLLRVQQMKKTTNLVIGEWEQREDGIQQRDIEYEMSIKVPILPDQQAKVVNVEMILSEGGQGKGYILEMHSVAPLMPYSNDFVPMMRFCVFDGTNAANISINVWIRWLSKKMLFKHKIDQVTMDGLKETANEYMTALMQELQVEE